MKRYFFLACCLVSFSVPAVAAPKAAKTSQLTVAQIINKNVAARGGLKAWRAVNTLTLSGRMEAGGKEDPELPFVMRMKRPHKSRLEIRFEEQTALQVYDGHQGWKVRPFLGRDDEVEPYTTAEAREAASWQELDGPLVDYAKKGTKVSLLGNEVVEGHKTYKLKLTMKSGEHRNVWIDASSFLERRIDGEPRKMDGKMRNVTVYYRDYQKEHGLMLPHTFETVIDGGKQPYKMYIEHVAVNQPMEDALFAKPSLALVHASGQTPAAAQPAAVSKAEKRP